MSLVELKNDRIRLGEGERPVKNSETRLYLEKCWTERGINPNTTVSSYKVPQHRNIVSRLKSLSLYKTPQPKIHHSSISHSS